MTEYISKSEKKRQFKQTEKVAAELVELSNSELKNLTCSEELKEEIVAARGLKGGSRKRQVKYVAKVMRLESLDGIYDFLERRKGSDLKTKQQFHEAERLRDTLINEAVESHQECQQNQVEWDIDWQSSEIPPLLKRYSELKESEIRKTIYNYVKSRNRVHYRELFRMMKGAIDQAEARKRLL
jgi:ribosome-associated protein